VKQRWALVLMGTWIAGSICMSVIATENFYTIDRLLAERSNPAFASAVDRLGAPQARDLLRYLSSELNRLYFQLWNAAQVALGGAVLWLIAGSKQRGPAYRRVQSGVVVMLAVAVFMLAYLTPAIVLLGRSLDFVPRDPAPPGMQRFWVLHAAYTTLEMIKLLFGVLVTFWIARRVEPPNPVSTTPGVARPF
jgi:hypothetical protein